MNQNNLDKLFQEKLEDFSSIPDAQVWERIEASLNNKRKKRVIPIWWGAGTAAAILIFALLLINPFKKGSNLKQNPVTNSLKEEVLSNEGLDNPKKEDVLDNNADNVLTENQKNDTETIKDSDGDKKGNRSFVTSKKNAPASQNEQLVRTSNRNYPQRRAEPSFKNDVNISETTTKVAELDEKVTDDSGSTEVTELGRQKENIIQDNSPIEEEAIVIENEDKKKSIYEAIEDQLNNDETAVAENSTEKWSIGPSVAPVYFNSIGQGSPIHSNFSENGKSGRVNLSYGIAVGYNLGKRLKIRSGVHRVNMGYSTEDIQFSSSVEGSTNAMIDNIDYNMNSRSLVVQSRKTSETANFNDSNNANAELAANTNPALDGSMEQQLGYFEVPMELNYALVDKKFGVNVIGGFSSLFLVDNSVSLEAQDGLVTEMGEANNVNSVNFSTNIGLGLNYQFSEKLQLNLEPVFKYQLNTFSESAGNFNPYSVGVYSGLSFKF